MEQAAVRKSHRSEQRQRGRIANFRVTEKEYQQIEELADREGLTFGSYLRTRALATPTTRATRRPTVAVKLLGGLLAQIGKIGSNLNQIARQLNQGAALPLSEIETTLAEHRQILVAIITALGKDKK